jgi:hypothetical protein
VISALLSDFIFPPGEDRINFAKPHYITYSGSCSQPEGGSGNQNPPG